MDTAILFKAIQQETLKSIGLPLTHFNVQYTNAKNVWTYDPSAKSFAGPKNLAINITQDKIEAEFAILHETSHMIQDFILNSGIDILNFNKETLQKAIKSFFKITNFEMTDDDFYNFQHFLNEYGLKNNDLIKHLKFDDKFYVSATNIEQYANDHYLLVKPNRIYLTNSTEVIANHFATNILFTRMKSKRCSPREMQLLRNKIYKHICKTHSFKKDNQDFLLQLNIYKYFHKENIKDKILNSVYRLKNYETYNFSATSKILSEKTRKMRDIIDEITYNYKTTKQIKQEIKEMQNAINIAKSFKESLYNTNIVTIILPTHNFEPLPQDKDKFFVSEYKNKSPEEMVKNIQTHINRFTKELIIDFKNLVIYNYHTARTQPMQETNEILNADEIQLSETKENKTLQHNDINQNER